MVMSPAALESKLNAIVEHYAARADTSDVRFELASPSRDWQWSWGAEDQPTQYFIASITKLYVTSIVMQLRSEGRVDIDEPAARYVPPGTMDGLNVLDDPGRGAGVTVRQLLAHTSGIGDYFEQKRADGGSTFGRALERDFVWDLDDVLRITRDQLTPRFPPGTPGKAYYSDTNYQVLGALIETVTGSSFPANVRDRIATVLGLADTYVFSPETLDRYDEIAPMLFGRTPLHAPLMMASVGADGAVVSTASDGIRFLEAFFGGTLFPSAYLVEMTRQWNRIFSPLEYGVGVMRFALPRYYSPFRPLPEFVGHSGASGAVLFKVEAFDLYISGTINQTKQRSLSYQLMTRLAMACDSAWR